MLTDKITHARQTQLSSLFTLTTAFQMRILCPLIDVNRKYNVLNNRPLLSLWTSYPAGNWPGNNCIPLAKHSKSLKIQTIQTAHDNFLTYHGQHHSLDLYIWRIKHMWMVPQYTMYIEASALLNWNIHKHTFKVLHRCLDSGAYQISEKCNWHIVLSFTSFPL